MPNFSVEDIRRVMGHPSNIRNISVIAHVDHGKSTLTDSLICRAGIISQKLSGDARYTDTREDEQERGVTIKSTGVTLYFDINAEKNEDGEEIVHPDLKGNLINLIDSPGHVDFSSEVTAALRVTDGALVVVDAVSGAAVQTVTVLRQALQERVRPVLFVNKVDRCMLEQQMNGEEMYSKFREAIEDINIVIGTYPDKLTGDVSVAPEKGTVAFGSALHGWAFNINRFATIYASKFGMEHDKMMKKLWGDHFTDGKKWSTDPCVGTRGFVKFIIDPIAQLVRACVDDDKEKWQKMVKSLGINLKKEQLELTGKALMKGVMQAWINAADTLLEMIVRALPSPTEAQKYRVFNLYEGPCDDIVAKGIAACDPAGPLCVYISKMVPTPDRGRFYAFGRVFSGTIGCGKRVRLQGPRYVPGSNQDVDERNVQRCVLMMGRTTEAINDVPAGNTVALVGMDNFIVKTCTITDRNDAHNIVPMKYSVSPVVRVAVRPKNAADIGKLGDALQKLSKSDPLVQIEKPESGDWVIAGCGELHMEICLKDLREIYLNNTVPIIDMEPVVPYRETCTEKSVGIAMTKSANKHNRLYVTACPLGPELTAAIEEGSIGDTKEVKERGKRLVDEFGWDKAHSEKIWFFGPDTTGPNLFMDETIGLQFLSEINPHVNSGFQWATKEGPLCGEPMRGNRFALQDVVLHADAIHRGSGQLLPASRRVMYASLLMAEPTLQEPVFLVEITCPQHAVAGVYNTLTKRRGEVIDEIPKTGTPQTTLKCYLPVAESFGFTAVLRQNTSGEAFPQSVFDHWDTLEGNALNEGSMPYKLCLDNRERKGLKNEPAKLSDYLDRL